MDTVERPWLAIEDKVPILLAYENKIEDIFISFVYLNSRAYPQSHRDNFRDGKSSKPLDR